MNRLVYAAAIVAIIAGIAVFLLNGPRGATGLASYDGVAVNSTTLSRLHAIANNQTLAATATAVAKVASRAADSTPLEYGGKPEVLYIGAEYCPFCASLRWGLSLALMRFGNFSALHYMTSSATDTPAGVPTFTFYGAPYSSALVYFKPVELTTNKFNSTTNSYPALQNMTPDERTILGQNDPPGSIPFVDFANASVVLGSAVSPTLIDGMPWQDIISQIERPGTPISQAIIGEANIYTAEICRALNNTASVCSQPYVSAIQKAQ